MNLRAAVSVVCLLASTACLAQQPTVAPAAKTAPAQEKKPGQLAITFDDLPEHSSLPQGMTRLEIAQRILKVIQQEHLPPITGMVNGFWLERDPKGSAGVLEAWRDAGQPIASHTWSHMNLNEKPLEQWTADVEKNEPLLQKMAAYPASAPQKQSWKYLRYPFLAEGETPEKKAAAVAWLTQHGYMIADVTMSWGDYNWNSVYARCVAKQEKTAIQRLHDTYLAAARQNMWAERLTSLQAFQRDIPHVVLMHIGAFDAMMFPELIAQMRADGYTFVSLPQAEMDPAYSTPLSRRAGGGFLEDQVAHAKGLPIQHRDDYSKELEAMCR
ncbi:polysaccharide deacetylase family protein [Granulicella cerasi]|uniref:Polysaccharide deacetylase family protein n=1 Tax=Granulicella cerasi TaxID=741063 RepID=A0ABW1ZAW3_9BACT|nr:polysaccharide deacetylase family protein [Granulicella cerasi]